MKDILNQLVSIWKQLGVNQRATIILTVLGVAGGLSALVVFSNRPQMQLLYGRLGEKDVSEVITAVQEQGVAYQLGAGGSAVYVPSDQVHRLRMLMASKGVPAGDGVGFEIFDRSNFGISDFVQRTNYMRALQGELSRTISQLKGVKAARVMIVVPENRLLFSETKSKPTASVFIDQASGALGSEAVNSIRFLVANAVEGLHVDDVAVIDSHGNVLTKNLSDDPSLGVASSQMKFRKSVEDYFSSKVETMLINVLGAGNAVVRVSAEIDTDSSTKTEEKFDPDGQVIRNETSTEDTTISKEAEGGESSQATGISANVPSSQESGKGGAKNSEQARKSKTNSYEINRTTTSAVKNPGGITRVSAAVFIAAKSQPRKPEELESLRKMVANALGVKSGSAQDAERSVTLQEVSFEGQAAGVTAEPKHHLSDLIYNNTDLLKNVVSGIVAIGLFGFFIRLLRRTKGEALPADLKMSDRLSGRNGISPEMLNDLIRQKPENVGAALRDWMTAPEGKK